MDDRIKEEFHLLTQAYPEALFKERWVLLPNYPLSDGWSRSKADVAFFLRPPYPGTSPYGIYTAKGLTFDGKQPANYAAAKPIPPFPGDWAVFSWQAEQWLPGAMPEDGHNMLTWANGMRRRFLEGL